MLALAPRLTVLVAMLSGNYEKSLENSASATKEYTRGATGNNDYRGISGGIIDNAIGGVVDWTGKFCVALVDVLGVVLEGQVAPVRGDTW